MAEIFQKQFHSKYSFASLIKNGGWKFIGMSMLTVIIILFHNDFNISFSSINHGNLFLFVGVTGPLILGILFATKEIKIENNIVYHRTVFPSKWKTFHLNDIHHICYFQKPVERFSIFPKVVFFRNEKKALAVLELLIPKADIYKLLSLTFDGGFPVLFFNEFKNIEEADYYVKTDQHSC